VAQRLRVVDDDYEDLKERGDVHLIALTVGLTLCEGP
jgi:hypothetical protein